MFLTVLFPDNVTHNTRCLLLLLLVFREQELFDVKLSDRIIELMSHSRTPEKKTGELCNAILNNERVSRRCELSDFHIRVLEIFHRQKSCRLESSR